MTGKLKPQSDSLDALAGALRADIERNRSLPRSPLVIDAHPLEKQTGEVHAVAHSVAAIAKPDPDAEG